MSKSVFCTDRNILVREFVDSQTESGIELGDNNNEPYSLYEIINLNNDTLKDISEVVGKELTEADLTEKYLLLYSGFARVPITKDRFIVHLKDCLAVIEKSKYKELVKD